MLLEIIATAARLMPFDKKARDIAGAAIMNDGHIPRVPDFSSAQVHTQTQIQVIAVQKISVVHPPNPHEIISWHHHERATYDRHDARFKHDRVREHIKPPEVRVMRKKTVKARHFDECAPRRQKFAPPPSLFATIRVLQSSAYEASVRFFSEYIQHRPKSSSRQIAVRVDKSKIITCGRGGPKIASRGKTQISSRVDQPNAMIRACALFERETGIRISSIDHEDQFAEFGLRKQTVDTGPQDRSRMIDNRDYGDRRPRGYPAPARLGSANLRRIWTLYETHGLHPDTRYSISKNYHCVLLWTIHYHTRIIFFLHLYLENHSGRLTWNIVGSGSPPQIAHRVPCQCRRDTPQ